MTNCEHCGSSRHPSEKCSSLALTQYLTGEKITSPDSLPETIYVAEGSIDEIAGAIKHLSDTKRKGK